MNLDRTDHVEVTIDDLILEHYDPPAVPPKTSAAMKGDPALRHGRSKKSGAMRRVLPHPSSLLGMLLLGGVTAGAGLVGRLLYKRFISA